MQDLSGRTVELTIRAPQDRWENLSPEDFTAFIDLTDLGAGEHDVEVQVTRFDTAVEVLDAQPNELHVELDEVQTKELPVRVVLMDGPAFGYDAQTPLVEPITVTVSGPATQVEQVINARRGLPQLGQEPGGSGRAGGTAQRPEPGGAPDHGRAHLGAGDRAH
ncbi:MAG: CdaR family protein [Caldilineaceae bacterium]